MVQVMQPVIPSICWQTLYVQWAINQYSLIYTAGQNGTIAANANQVVEHGADGSPVEVIPDEGYRFVRWNDEVTMNPRIDTNVTSDIAVTAIFHMVGDVNGNSIIDGADLVLALQSVSRIPVLETTVYEDADVDGDGKIGLAEVIYISQALSLRNK
jgi:hypothetical protein